MFEHSARMKEVRVASAVDAVAEKGFAGRERLLQAPERSAELVPQALALTHARAAVESHERVQELLKLAVPPARQARSLCDEQQSIFVHKSGNRKNLHFCLRGVVTKSNAAELHTKLLDG